MKQQCAAQQIAARPDFPVQIARLDPAQHGGFESAEAEIERVALHFAAGPFSR